MKACSKESIGSEKTEIAGSSSRFCHSPISLGVFSIHRLPLHWGLQMNRLEEFLGKACDGCLLCRYARENPKTLAGRVMSWHGKWCPAWKAQ